MAAADTTYVIFDGDEDKWAYAYMKGWKVNDRVNFDFRDAHDLGSMTARAQDEAYVKAELKKRMAKSSQVVVLVGEKTKNLYKFVRWEIELAIGMGLPIIVVNLNDKKSIDNDLCPPLLREHYAVHVPFKLAAIKHALDNFPSSFYQREAGAKGPRHYKADWYKSQGM